MARVRIEDRVEVRTTAAPGQDLERLVADADRELDAKGRKQLDEETAYKWGARAVAAYRRWEATKDPEWLADAESYYHEGVEHAALSDHDGGVLARFHEWFHQNVPHGVL